MDEYLFITLAKLRFDARKLRAQDANRSVTQSAVRRSAKDVRPQYVLDEAATRSHRASHKARWSVPESEYGEQS